MIGNIGPVQLLIILLIVLLIFGTKRIRSLGSDLGGAIKEFRNGMNDDSSNDKGGETNSHKHEKTAHTDASSKSDESDASDSSNPKQQ